MCGVKVGLCLPRMSCATRLASRPSGTSAASTTCHSCEMSLGLAEKVFIRPRAPDENRRNCTDSKTSRGQRVRSRPRPAAMANSTSSCPFSTACPGCTRTPPRTRPAAGARSSFSIFMASSTTSPCPASTSLPRLDQHPDHQARHRRLELTGPSAWPPRRRSGSGCGGSARPPPPPRTAPRATRACHSPGLPPLHARASATRPSSRRCRSGVPGTGERWAAIVSPVRPRTRSPSTSTVDLPAAIVTKYFTRPPAPRRSPRARSGETDRRAAARRAGTGPAAGGPSVPHRRPRSRARVAGSQEM